MSQFIEITEGVFVKKDEIIAVIDNNDGTIDVRTENSSFTITAEAVAILSVLDEEVAREEKAKRFTTQFFGG